ncbi:hypothetical protein VP191E371_P0023 [Vibrio phage 191E37-1]|nr:hypothetical protein VP115E341_P0022 [Vibrio phage 115E34-1]CAH9011923.1 hypothetical protein VP191E371_P0023 [Vibrio phage 191E37-1]
MHDLYEFFNFKIIEVYINYTNLIYLLFLWGFARICSIANIRI